MGFESFRVELRGVAQGQAEVDGLMRRIAGVKPDPDAIQYRGAFYYTCEDGLHVIEVEVAGSPVKVSCRFTICHPPSVESAFLGLVRELMVHLGMEARICDDVRPEHARWFSIDRFPEFASALSIYVASRRAEWIAQFGPTQFPARTREVYARIILPHCEPVIGADREAGRSGWMAEQYG